MSDPFPVDRVFGLRTPASPWGVPMRLSWQSASKDQDKHSYEQGRLCNVNAADSAGYKFCALYRRNNTCLVSSVSRRPVSKHDEAALGVSDGNLDPEKRRKERRKGYAPTPPHASFRFGMEPARIPALALVLLGTDACLPTFFVQCSRIW